VPSEPEKKPEPISVELDGDSERIRVLGASRPLACQGKESDAPSEPDPRVEAEEEPEPISVELEGDSERVRVLGANRPLGKSLKLLLACVFPATVSTPASIETASNLWFMRHLLLNFFTIVVSIVPSSCLNRFAADFIPGAEKERTNISKLLRRNGTNALAVSSRGDRFGVRL
jgi:hypothetical protein